MNVLRNTHAPENDGRLRRCIKARYFTNLLSWDTTDFSHSFRLIILQVFFELVKTNNHVIQILLLVQFLFQDHVHHGVDQTNVSAILELQHVTGMLMHAVATRIHNNQLGTT